MTVCCTLASIPGPVFISCGGEKQGLYWQGPSAHALAITNTLGNRILLFVNLSVHHLVLSVNSASSQTRTWTYYPCSLPSPWTTSTIGTCRLATSRYLPFLAEATMLTTYLYSRGAHSLTLGTTLHMENFS